MPVIIPGSVFPTPPPSTNSIGIIGLGDSISAGGGLYSPSEVDISLIPQWTTGTVVPAGYSVKNAGLIFYTVAGGTTGASAPTPAVPNDGSVLWVWNQANITKTTGHILTWAEIFSNGRLVWDMTMGYGGPLFGVAKVMILTGGSGYVNPVAAFTNGATGTVQSINGVITGVTINSPGFGGATCTITGAPGTGCTTKCVQGGTGSFGVGGDTTGGMFQRVSDAANSTARIVVVHGGTNDANGGVAPATTIASLKAIYERLMDAGKLVVAIPVTPATTLDTTTKINAVFKINNFIRAYCRGETWANPSGYQAIRLADATRYFTDSAASLYAPVGGTPTTGNAMTQDGLHPGQRGHAYHGYAVWQAVQGWVGGANDNSGTYTVSNAYDITNNPGGNILETVVAGSSIFSSGTAGAKTAAGGIVFSGNLATGYTIARVAGSASGTVACSIENPYSSGEIGSRQVLVFTLGSGTTNEQWRLSLASAVNATWGILAGDLGTTKLQIEAELELSVIANAYGPTVCILGDRFLNKTGFGTSLVGGCLPASTGEPFVYPNRKLLYRTQPMVVHALNTTLQPSIDFTFDASGGAGSATLTVKINYINMHRYGQG